MLSHKTNVIIQCRFSSTRLPGKAMYPLCGIPLLVFLIRRMKSGLPDNAFRLIVASTQNSEDDSVAAWAEDEGVHLIRGAQEDVLSRYIKVINAYPSDVNVRVTGDNPLTCPQALIDCVSLMKTQSLDYVQSKDFPHGIGIDVFSASVLNQLDQCTINALDREHINLFILKNPNQFRTGTVIAKNNEKRPDLNMTVDTLEDFKRVSSIFDQATNSSAWNLSLEKAIQYLDQTITAKQEI